MTRIIGLMGYAQAGKDSTAAVLAEVGYERLAFADPLRQMLYALNPLVPCVGAYYRVRDLVDTHGWDVAKTEYPEIRALLQRLGTEGGRDVLGQNIWVETAVRKVKPKGLYVFTDVRFPNEVNAVKGLGGELWRVHRPGTGATNGHVSESALDDVMPDRTIYNGGDLTYLADRVAEALMGRVRETLAGS